MKRPLHSRASRYVRLRRQSAARRDVVSPGARLVRVECVGHVEGDFANVISQYDYTYDAAGRRIEIARFGSVMSESRTDSYGYNIRNELTSASKLGGTMPEYAYQYDDIGNRITSTDLGTNRTYIANNLNQYSFGSSNGESQIVLIHEIGHLLGMNHPGQTDESLKGNRPKENSSADYDVNPRSLMGSGMVLKDVDFNNAFCSHLNNRNIGKNWKASSK